MVHPDSQVSPLILLPSTSLKVVLEQAVVWSAAGVCIHPVLGAQYGTGRLAAQQPQSGVKPAQLMDYLRL